MSPRTAVHRFEPSPHWDPLVCSSHPVFAPIAAAASAFAHERSWPPVETWGEAWNAAPPLVNAIGLPVRFVVQPAKPRRRARLVIANLYDERIFSRGEVPSREESWHDFFNMLVWRSFPKAKAAVNAAQRAALRAWLPEGATSIPGARTAEQDALTMLDEGGLVLLHAGPQGPLDEALSAGDQAALIALVGRGSLAPMVFGHALYEHLATGWSRLRAAAVVVRANELPATLPDRLALADELLAETLARGPFRPSGGVFVERGLFESTATGALTH